MPHFSPISNKVSRKGFGINTQDCSFGLMNLQCSDGRFSGFYPTRSFSSMSWYGPHFFLKLLSRLRPTICVGFPYRPNPSLSSRSQPLSCLHGFFFIAPRYLFYPDFSLFSNYDSSMSGNDTDVWILFLIASLFLFLRNFLLLHIINFLLGLFSLGWDFWSWVSILTFVFLITVTLVSCYRTNSGTLLLLFFVFENFAYFLLIF